MRTGFADNMRDMDPMHDMHERVAPEPEAPQDLTLGMTALLGIFLAVVLVCAVFFGFGYSTGRTLHGSPLPTGTSQAPPAKPAATSDEAAGSSTALSIAPPLTPATPLPKPSPAAAMIEAPPVSSVRADESASESQAQATHPRPQLAADAPSAKHAAQLAETAAGSAGIMVQIAAVARQGDADALARALRSNGYSAIVRTEPQDAFLHVQVGPFASRDTARAMRARLQAAGYNAFIKP